MKALARALPISSLEVEQSGASTQKSADEEQVTNGEQANSSELGNWASESNEASNTDLRNKSQVQQSAASWGFTDKERMKLAPMLGSRRFPSLQYRSFLHCQKCN